MISRLNLRLPIIFTAFLIFSCSSFALTDQEKREYKQSIEKMDYRDISIRVILRATVGTAVNCGVSNVAIPLALLFDSFPGATIIPDIALLEYYRDGLDKDLYKNNFNNYSSDLGINISNLAHQIDKPFNLAGGAVSLIHDAALLPVDSWNYFINDGPAKFLEETRKTYASTYVITRHLFSSNGPCSDNFEMIGILLGFNEGEEE